MLPRAQFDVSALYYQKGLYEDEAKKAAYKEKTGKDLTPPDTWEEVTAQAEFLASPPDFYGTQFAGKEEAIARLRSGEVTEEFPASALWTHGDVTVLCGVRR